MAFLTHRQARVHDEVPTSSMADIAFLLLIFFLVTTVFPKDRGLAIVLPQDEVDVNQRNVLHLLVQPDGEVHVRRGESTDVTVARATEIEAIWRQDVAANPFLIAAVKTHPTTPYRFMVDVLDALRTAGAERISLQVLEE
jgi:biopolymer transport protein ExbD